MPVTFQVVGNLADFGNDVRADVMVRATATPGVKVGDVAVHSNEPETVVTDAAGAFVLELVSLPGVWYRIRTPYANAINTVHLAGYVPDVDDPTTGTVFAPGVVIDLRSVMDEDPTPGYEAIAYVGGGGGGGGYLDHGDQSGAVSYAATIGTHALTMTADTTVALTGGSNGDTVRVWAMGAFVLTVEGVEVTTGECVATMVRDVWEVRVIGGGGGFDTLTIDGLSTTYEVQRDTLLKGSLSGNATLTLDFAGAAAGLTVVGYIKTLGSTLTWGGVAVTGTGVTMVSAVWDGEVAHYSTGSTLDASGVPVDSTAPTAGTLAVTTTQTTAALSVAGAMDETALHATPFAYSTDNGATWTGWLAGADRKSVV